ncbi:sam dependent methyltransferase [Gordonia hydrophobica]|uniref:Sam dependent methyltransferase n=1 Tax=Gordonia hydrophobica TaxID=40516 RepID=A0ABZ2U1V4_9ACTN|nr:sam dependent methyltransferase [Gordonia hydrophobica]MBM7366747.1 DNA repair photolyase [Gordonia hydrophobica]
MTALPELVCGDLVRSTILPEAPGVRVQEMLARSMLESVTSDRKHRHSFAVSPVERSGEVLRVKLNGAAVLRREVRRRSWRCDTVALGVDDDPYHPVEEHYRLMPQVLSVLSESQTPIALYTASPLVLRDLSLLRLIGRTVPVTVSIPLATLDAVLAARVDPAAASPAVRLGMVEELAGAGLAPHIRIAPLPPLLADGTAQLEELLAALADAGAARVSVSPLQLDDDAGADFLEWLADEHPALVRRYRSLYGRRGFVSADYAMSLRGRMAPLVERHGLGSATGVDGVDREEQAVVPPAVRADAAVPELTLF